MAELCGYTRRILNCGQAIRSEGVTKAILRPVQKASHFTQALDFPARGCGNNMTCRSAVSPEPRRQIRQYRHDSAACALCLCCLYFDMSACKIDFVPIESLNLRVPESGERANCEHWQDISSLRCSI